ncbi:outer membrane lipoprotein chaperone LolA [candidate division KSB1 bacterium]|nr:outer membrane lipoprotein chaperone LolA [candidate division KSB1 bacterium]
MRSLSINTIVLILFIGSIHTLWAIDAEDIIDKVKNKYEEIGSLTANFTQSFKWKLAGESQEQHGSLFIKGKNKFRIETEGQIVVSDGTNLWTYSKSNNQVIIDNVDNAEEVILPREIFLKFSQNYNPQYLREEKYNNTDCYVVNLIAKTDNQFIREMKIWVARSSWLTQKVQHTDINENITTYSLRSIKVNQDLKDTVFSLQIPENVEVVDMR